MYSTVNSFLSSLQVDNIKLKEKKKKVTYDIMFPDTIFASKMKINCENLGLDSRTQNLYIENAKKLTNVYNLSTRMLCLVFYYLDLNRQSNLKDVTKIVYSDINNIYKKISSKSLSEDELLIPFKQYYIFILTKKEEI